jgi:2-polyprenyl-3-methyl-5-hydroxy-6-metoxy-1,4-benzoquinol methylase
MLISEAYRSLNAELHARNPTYGTSGIKWAGKVYRLAKQYEATSVLDYGCGRGLLWKTLQELVPAPFCVFAEYDPAIEGKDKPPDRADFVVCGDVLEHIEPECLDAVLDDLHRLTKKAILLIVATTPAMKTLADGRNAHLIVEPPEWWFPKLAARWKIKNFEDRGGAFLCLGEAK